MNKHKQIIDFARGKIVSGKFTKLDNTTREFWGVLKHEDRDKDYLVTVFDYRKKQYRRFRLDVGNIVLNVANTTFHINNQEENSSEIKNCKKNNNRGYQQNS